MGRRETGTEHPAAALAIRPWVMASSPSRDIIAGRLRANTYLTGSYAAVPVPEPNSVAMALVGLSMPLAISRHYSVRSARSRL